MKLRNLNGAIRKAAPAVTVVLHTPAGDLTVALQKSSLLDALKALPVDPSDETGLTVTDAGVLTWATRDPVMPDRRPSPTVGSLLDDDDQIDLEEAIAAKPAITETLLDD